MIICTWNINGIKSLLDHDLSPFLKYSVDVLLLQEVRTGSVDLIYRLARQLNLPHVYYNLSAKTSRAGVAILSRKLPLRQYTPDYILPQEGRILVVELEDICIVTLYSPYMGRDLVNLSIREQWEEGILNFLLTLKDQQKALLIGGDLNVAPTTADRYKVSNNQPGCSQREATMFSRLSTTLDLRDAFREVHGPTAEGYTWGLHEGKLRLDYFLLSRGGWKILNCGPVYELHSHPGPKMPSDHYPLIIEIDKSS